MKLSKQDRHRKILEIIAADEIATQEELVKRLQADRLSITQATVSRDIKELNIIKANTKNGKQKFVAMRTMHDPGTDRLLKVFGEAVLNSVTAGNLIVVHTLPGMAPACASAIDAMNITGVAGTIAGDDTIFIAAKTGVDVELMEHELMQFAAVGKRG
ncbi:MAG: arginine repressor [Clostridia bacterium]|nr:arginine repressor [Clostridia bacterium]NLF21153.1 arginine repressor [Clostridiaceae bacterium]